MMFVKKDQLAPHCSIPKPEAQGIRNEGLCRISLLLCAKGSGHSRYRVNPKGGVSQLERNEQRSAESGETERREDASTCSTWIEKLPALVHHCAARAFTMDRSPLHDPIRVVYSRSGFRRTWAVTLAL